MNELSNVIKHLEFECVEEEVSEIMQLLDKNGDGRIQFHGSFIFSEVLF